MTVTCQLCGWTGQDTDQLEAVQQWLLHCVGAHPELCTVSVSYPRTVRPVDADGVPIGCGCGHPECGAC